jgi:hypothetical protein
MIVNNVQIKQTSDYQRLLCHFKIHCFQKDNKSVFASVESSQGNLLMFTSTRNALDVFSAQANS